MGNPLDLIGQIFNPIFYQPVFNLLMMIYLALNHIFPAGAFPLAIVILTLLLRTALIPLTRKQLKSTREMQVLQPKLKELQAQYRSDPQELMRRQQALYKEHGVNPASGCLPLIIQMPFLYALYFSFRDALQVGGLAAITKVANINKNIYPFLPHVTVATLPHTQFFWTSLATPDPMHILPVVAALLTFFQMRMATPVRKPGPRGASDATTQATSMMQYIMPFMTLFIGLSFPAGLALYWCVTTTFSAVQQYFISGWGSFWVGVPGMQHLVPEPKDTPALATASAARTAAPARGLPAAAVVDEQPGGLRGMLKQIRDTMGAAQSVAATQAAERTSERAGAKNGGGDVASYGVATAGPNGSTTATSSRGGRPQTQRPPKAAVLVKPKAPAAAEKTELPEQAIARDATEVQASTSADLPEVAIAKLASDAKNGDGRSSGNGNRNGNGAAPAAGAKRAAANASGSAGANNRPSNAARKPGSKNASSSRSRGGRPKGGR
ncbi:MAG TPA: YidC/Oxa1 family membrane protein insertase [Ktedonobacterales bacterium]|nr:YidC/Oxa1 family membrane protein insertase [Ktedonobacterales bacterium]